MSSQLEGVELFYVNSDLKDEFIAKDIVDDLDTFLNEGGNLSDLVNQLDEDTKNVFVTSEAIKPESHVKAQAVWQKYVDSGISKTINLSSAATEVDVWDSYVTAWKLGCKGITVYRQGSRMKEVLVSMESSEKEESKPAPFRVSRLRTLLGSTTKVRTGLGNLYVTVNKDSDGEVYEVFATTGKAGGNETANTEAICRLISIAMQHGVPVVEIISQLSGIQSVPVWDNGVQVLSTADGIARVLKEVGGSAVQQQTARVNLDKTLERFSAVIDEPSSPKCPDCNSVLYAAEGCNSCASCGYSRCGA
jgi:ribonucleoside-diphosphate reductase alpha chain